MFNRYRCFGITLLSNFFTFGILLADSPSMAAGAEKGDSYFDALKVFQSCPIIYSLLIFLSVASVVIWLYSLFTVKLSEMMPKPFLAEMRKLLMERQFETALQECQNSANFVGGIIASGIATRRHGPQVVIEAMQAEGRRAGNSLWQRLSLLNEIAVVAPMLGLLGTVLGLFFAFYDSNRSVESIATIFDGLGVAVGTTVVGLIVAILSMIFYTSLKFRIVNVLNTIENESLALVSLIDDDSFENKRQSR